MKEISDSALTEWLSQIKTIAVVGLSDDPGRASHGVSAYMKSAGYRILPINPAKASTTILGETVHGDLAGIGLAPDLVNVFRRSESVPEIVEQAIAIGAKGLWLQLGITHPEAEEAARKAGLAVVSDRCLMVEHRRLIG